MQKIDYILYIMLIIVCLMGIYFIYNYVKLKDFKSCYDINFQDIKCVKYLNY